MTEKLSNGLKARPISSTPPSDVWKIDKIAFEKGQAPTWVNDLLKESSFFVNNENLCVVDISAGKQPAFFYEGDWLIKAPDEETDEGKIKKGKVSGVPVAKFEERWEIIK